VQTERATYIVSRGRSYEFDVKRDDRVELNDHDTGLAALEPTPQVKINTVDVDGEKIEIRREACGFQDAIEAVRALFSGEPIEDDDAFFARLRMRRVLPRGSCIGERHLR
jgi:hypothetical protein